MECQEKKHVLQGRAEAFVYGRILWRYEDGDHFVILTTGANASMKQVHGRMPLVIERDEIARWILDDSSTEAILRKPPCLLEQQAEYEQLTLF